nr:hypothetical protein BaRGS_004608 [Batillaria attramentaria]
MPRKLSVLDVRGCPLLTFPRNMLNSTVSLQAVYSDNYKLCCPASLPADFNLNNCQAPSDEISSCGHLLGSSLHRIVLPVFAALALLGNAGSLVLNILLKPSRPVFSTDVFLCNLYASNWLMGVYLAMIGVADRLYQGTYLWEDVQWRNSVALGLLSLVASPKSGQRPGLGERYCSCLRADIKPYKLFSKKVRSDQVESRTEIREKDPSTGLRSLKMTVDEMEEGYHSVLNSSTGLRPAFLAPNRETRKYLLDRSHRSPGKAGYIR